MKKQNKNHEENESTTHFMPIFMSIGVGTGVAIGAAMNNIAIGMSIGLGIGLAVGSAIDAINRNKADDASKKENENNEQFNIREMMIKNPNGKVISATKQWWLKVNRKAIRMGSLDGAEFPYIIKVEYVADGITYKKLKWIGAGKYVPAVGSNVMVEYREENPKKAKIIL